MQKICKCEVEYGTASYLYRKNLFGDVTEIYNEAGTLVGKYSYTAFGVCTLELDTNGIATKNPIRYRSYYYDDETELYYLKSRYYDPEVGRFITIDDISFLVPGVINGLNLYAYCGNNPVMNVDPSGKLIGILLIIGFLIGAAIEVAALIKGGTFAEIVNEGNKISTAKDVADLIKSTVELVEVLSSVEKVKYMHTMNVLGYGYYGEDYNVLFVSAFGGKPEDYLRKLEGDFMMMQEIVDNLDEKRKTPEGILEINSLFTTWAAYTKGQMSVFFLTKILTYAETIYSFYWGVMT